MSVARQLWVTGEAPPWKPKLGPRQRQQGPPAGEKPKGSRKLELFPHLFSQVFLSSHRAPPSQYLGGLWSRQLHARALPNWAVSSALREAPPRGCTRRCHQFFGRQTLVLKHM